jgi:hypothetical protein
MNKPPKKKQRRESKGGLDIEELKWKLEFLRKEKEDVGDEVEEGIQQDKKVDIENIGDLTKMREEIEALEGAVEKDERIEQDKIKA